jgi:tetratricopeptide (TPR) repeat protein
MLQAFAANVRICLMVHVLSRSDAYRADGTRRTEQEVLAEFGPIGSRLVFLQDAAHRLEEELAYEVHYPPKLFLAYKWDDEVHNAWVRSVAEKLTANGWDVVFDAFRNESVDPLVEDFVSRLLTCRVFAAVITPAYIEHAGALNSNRPTWVFDEFQIALRASDDLLQCVGLWHSGDARPPLPFIIDLRGEDDAGVQQLLEKHLRYDGPKLGPDEGAGLVSLLRDTLGQSDAATVARLREGLDRYPFVAALWRRVVCILRDRGDLADALQAAEQAVANVHVWDQRLFFQRERIVMLDRLGRSLECLQAACELSSDHPLDWYAHFQIGNQLDSANELWAARNHLKLACTSPHAQAAAHNTLGVVYLGLGFSVLADRCFEEALRIDSTLEMAQRNLDRARRDDSPRRDLTHLEGHLTGCSNCSAMFFLSRERPVLCWACGAHRPFDGACPYCGLDQGLDGVIGFMKVDGEPSKPVCPICRVGMLIAKDSVDL